MSTTMKNQNDHHFTELQSETERFLSHARTVIEHHLDDPAFSTETFARHMFLSRAQLYRKLKALTGMGPSAFVRHLRLERAALFLRRQVDSISRIAFLVGFENLSYFAKCFRRKYGVAPSEFKKKAGNGRESNWN